MKRKAMPQYGEEEEEGVKERVREAQGTIYEVSEVHCGEERRT